MTRKEQLARLARVRKHPRASRELETQAAEVQIPTALRQKEKPQMNDALRQAGLSPQRARVLQFIVSRKTFPTAREIAAHMGWKGTTGVSDVLNTLAGCGLLMRDRSDVGRRPYLWQITEHGRSAAKELETAE